MYRKTKALVLRETEYKDADKLLTVLSGEFGKMTIKARGVRKASSRMKGACQLLTYSEFTLLDYNGYLVITEAEPLELFPGLRSDLELLALASYFAQVAEVVSQEDSPNGTILSLTLNALYALSKLKRPQKLVKAAFELKTAAIAGFTPELTACPVCGRTTPDRFDVRLGTVHCAECRLEEEAGLRLPVSLGTLAAMRHIVYGDPRRLFSFQLREQSLDELAGVAETYLTTQLEYGFYTLDFYKNLLITQGKEYV